MNTNTNGSRISLEDAVRTICGDIMTAEDFKENAVRLFMRYSLMVADNMRHSQNVVPEHEVIDDLFFLQLLSGRN